MCGRFNVLGRLIAGCLLHLVVLSCFTRSGIAQGIPTFGVCELLNDVKKWSESIVAVRGELAFSFEMVAVREECATELKIDGRRWMSAVWLSSPQSGDRTVDGADPRSVDFLYGMVRLLRDTYTDSITSPRKDPFVITATFVGRLKTLRSYGVTILPDGTRSVEPGLGNWNAYPAELELIAVRAISITEDKALPRASPDARQ